MKKHAICFGLFLLIASFLPAMAGATNWDFDINPCWKIGKDDAKIQKKWYEPWFRNNMCPTHGKCVIGSFKKDWHFRRWKERMCNREKDAEKRFKKQQEFADALKRWENYKKSQRKAKPPVDPKGRYLPLPTQPTPEDKIDQLRRSIKKLRRKRAQEQRRIQELKRKIRRLEKPRKRYRRKRYRKRKKPNRYRNKKRRTIKVKV